MALSHYTKIAFVRGLGISACYLDINARAIQHPQVYGVLGVGIRSPPDSLHMGKRGGGSLVLA
jgi:hypothetical protein